MADNIRFRLVDAAAIRDTVAHSVSNDTAFLKPFIGGYSRERSLYILNTLDQSITVDVYACTAHGNAYKHKVFSLTVAAGQRTWVFSDTQPLLCSPMMLVEVVVTAAVVPTTGSVTVELIVEPRG